MDFTRRFLVLGNLGLLAWVFLAFLGVLFYSFIYSWLYLFIELVLIYGILRRMGCGSCYQCKACTSGFGRLAGAFFGKGFIKKASVGKRFGVIAFTYFLLLPVPAALTVLSIVHAVSVPKVLVLICLLAISAYSFTTWLSVQQLKVET